MIANYILTLLKNTAKIGVYLGEGCVYSLVAKTSAFYRKKGSGGLFSWGDVFVMTGVVFNF